MKTKRSGSSGSFGSSTRALALPGLRGWTRRDFLAAGALTSAAVATGCVTNPVSGRRQFMLYGESWEMDLDKQYAPHQFSSHYGPLQDAALNAYIDARCKEIGALSHRPHMPYNMRALNVSMANGYTFPAGTMALTRGLLLEMGSEAELMALIGHEVGHVAARHTARRMSAAQLTMLLVMGTALAAGTRDENTGVLVAGLGVIGAGLFFAKYSRKDERQADKLGMDYAVNSGYPPQGMVDLHSTLIRLYGSRRNVIEQMFASHPMSQERHDTAVRRTGYTKYAEAGSYNAHRERYMDQTASIRAQADAIRNIQQGDKELTGGRIEPAMAAYTEALKTREADYEALLKMAKCHLHRDRPNEARRFAQAARQAYPGEPQALHVLSMAELNRRRYEDARNGFSEYARVLPGNPETVFYIGRCEEGLGRRSAAAERYKAYLNTGSTGPNADHARTRLTEWGMLTA